MDKKLTAAVDTDKLRDQLFHKIKESIFSGEFDTEEVFTEVSIAKRYQVSRTPAHDALHMLESERLIEPVGKRGFKLSLMQEADLSHIFDAAKAFEGMTAELVAKNHDDELIAGLKEIVSGMLRPQIDVYSEELVSKNRNIDFEFHTQIAKASKNPYLYRSVRMIQEKILVRNIYNPIIQYYLVEPEPFSACTHERILEAITLGDAALARHLMVRHFTLIEELLKKYM